MTSCAPIPQLASINAYARDRHGAPCDLDLGGTESQVSAPLAEDGADVLAGATRYPDPAPLARALAGLHGIAASHVLVTAGADDALERACRAMLCPGRNAILTNPTFEMIPRYVALTGADTRFAPWPSGALPVGEIISRADANTTLIGIVTPNNPTGSAASLADIARVHDAVPQALVLLDLAYADFAAEDLTRALLGLPRAIVVRTLSKAWGLPGLRVGYAMSDPAVLRWLRDVGSPFPVASASLAVAERTVVRSAAVRDETVSRTRANRARLCALLTELGVEPLDTQANFVTVAGDRARWIRDVLAGFGIATRFFTGGDCARTRITVPVDARALVRVEHALRCGVDPEVVLFDLDGVIADVSNSYRETIQRTAAAFGATVSAGDIRERKARGHANDDWRVTADLVHAAGINASLEDVTNTFERIYQGDAGSEGLNASERPLVSREWLASFASRCPLGIVTGRPRADARFFLDRFGLTEFFAVVVVREDAPLKPNPAPITRACTELGVKRAWMIGDTRDDIVAARAANALPIGVVPPGDPPDDIGASLTHAGAARVLGTTMEVRACLS